MSEAVIRLTFPAKADYLLLARLALGGVVRDLSIGPELLADSAARRDRGLRQRRETRVRRR